MEPRKDEREKEDKRKRRRRIRGIIQGFRRRVEEICGAVGDTTDFLDQVIEIGRAIRDFLNQEDLLDEDVRRHLEEALDELEKVRDGMQPLSDVCGKITRALDLADQMLAAGSSRFPRRRVAALAAIIAAIIGGLVGVTVVLSNLSSPAQPIPPVITEPTVPTPAPVVPIGPQATPVPPTVTPFPTPTPAPQPTATPFPTATPVIVVLPPMAEFSGTPLRGGCQFRVQFFDQSKNADSYFWDFGDGTTSTERDPVHTYTLRSEGMVTYTVTLTVGSSGGKDSIRKDNYITSQCIL